MSIIPALVSTCVGVAVLSWCVMLSVGVVGACAGEAKRCVGGRR